MYIYVTLHKNELAIEDTTEALKLQPSNVKALFRRALAKKVCLSTLIVCMLLYFSISGYVYYFGQTGPLYFLQVKMSKVLH